MAEKKIPKKRVVKSKEARAYLLALKKAGYAASMTKEDAEAVYINIEHDTKANSYTVLRQVAEVLADLYLKHRKLPTLNIVRAK